MKVMVVFHLPEGAGLLHCLLSDLTLCPAVKSTYVFNRRVYEVVRPIEIPGRRLDGTPHTVRDTLQELLAAVAPLSSESAIAKMANMRSVGHDLEEEEAEPRKASLIVNTADMFSAFKTVERVVVLDMKYVATLQPLNEEALLRGQVTPANTPGADQARDAS